MGKREFETHICPSSIPLANTTKEVIRPTLLDLGPILACEKIAALTRSLILAIKLITHYPCVLPTDDHLIRLSFATFYEHHLIGILVIRRTVVVELQGIRQTHFAVRIVKVVARTIPILACPQSYLPAIT